MLSVFYLTCLVYHIPFNISNQIFRKKNKIKINVIVFVVCNIYLSSSPVFCGVRITRSLVLCVCLICRSLFVFLSLFYWILCCLSYLNLRILITPLVSSNFYLATPLWFFFLSLSLLKRSSRNTFLDVFASYL